MSVTKCDFSACMFVPKFVLFVPKFVLFSGLLFFTRLAGVGGCVAAAIYGRHCLSVPLRMPLGSSSLLTVQIYTKNIIRRKLFVLNFLGRNDFCRFRTFLVQFFTFQLHISINASPHPLPSRHRMGTQSFYILYYNKNLRDFFFRRAAVAHCYCPRRYLRASPSISCTPRSRVRLVISSMVLLHDVRSLELSSLL